MKKGVLRNFTKFTGKHLCQSLFFNKVAGLRPTTLLKKRLCYRCFPVNFAKFLRTPFLQNTSGRLLLFIASIKSKYKNDGNGAKADMKATTRLIIQKLRVVPITNVPLKINFYKLFPLAPWQLPCVAKNLV